MPLPRYARPLPMRILLGSEVEIVQQRPCPTGTSSLADQTYPICGIPDSSLYKGLLFSLHRDLGGNVNLAEQTSRYRATESYDHDPNLVDAFLGRPSTSKRACSSHPATAGDYEDCRKIGQCTRS